MGDTNEKKLFEKLIPYCAENFITIPLWEEGDYRPCLNIWQIPKGKTPIQCVNSYSKIVTLTDEFFDKNGEYEYDIEDDFTGNERNLPINMKNSFKIRIYQKGHVLDVIPDYSINKLMKVGIELLKYLENGENS